MSGAPHLQALLALCLLSPAIVYSLDNLHEGSHEFLSLLSFLILSPPTHTRQSFPFEGTAPQELPLLKIIDSLEGRLAPIYCLSPEDSVTRVNQLTSHSYWTCSLFPPAPFPTLTSSQPNPSREVHTCEITVTSPGILTQAGPL